MKTNVPLVIGRVLARLDESGDVLDDAVEFGSPDFDLRELVKELLPGAAERVVLEAETCEIAESVPISGEPVRLLSGGLLRTLLPLPSHCLRFLYLRMSDWAEEVSEPLRSGSAGADVRRLWRARYGSGYGSPAVALTRYDGGMALEVFGTSAGSAVEDSGFVPRPEIAGDWLHFPSSLESRLVEELVRTVKEMRG